MKYSEGLFAWKLSVRSWKLMVGRWDFLLKPFQRTSVHLRGWGYMKSSIWWLCLKKYKEQWPKPWLLDFVWGNNSTDVYRLHSKAVVSISWFMSQGDLLPLKKSHIIQGQVFTSSRPADRRKALGTLGSSSQLNQFLYDKKYVDQ